MKTNYEINMDKIINDYFKCLGSFANCTIIYKELKNNYIQCQTEEEQAIKKGMEEDLLSNLGKVGEKAFKYIIGLENLRLNPNQDSNTFESLWKKTPTLKEFARRHGIEDDLEIKKLIDYHDDNNQKAHNFDYWFSVISIIMPEIYNKYNQFIIYNMQSKMLIKHCEKNNEFKYFFPRKYDVREEISLPFRLALFPSLVDMRYEFSPSIPSTMINFMLENKRKIIKKNGDIFTRLRYASNNIDNREFDIDEVYELIKNIVSFIRMIHAENNNLSFDLNKSFAKKQALKYSEYLGLTEEEIIDLFSLDFSGEDLAVIIFEQDYPYKNIKKLLEIGVPKIDIRAVMREGLQARTIQFFYSKGIRDYRRMRYLLDYFIEYGEYPNEEYKLKKQK